MPPVGRSAALPPSLVTYMCLGLQNVRFMLFTHGGTFPRRRGRGTQLCNGLVLGPLFKGCSHPYSLYLTHLPQILPLKLPNYKTKELQS